MIKKSSRSLFRLMLLSILVTAAQVRADFIGEKGHQFSGSGGWWYNSFTITGSSKSFTLYFTSRYNCAALVAPQSQLSNFTNGNTVSYIDGYDGNFGVKNVTLSPGSYFVGVRNKASGSNTFSLELEEHPIVSSGATFVQAGIQGAETVTAGGYLVHDFTIQNGYRYIIDGNNSGNLSIYFIPRSEKSKFIARQTFNYYTGYGGIGDTNEPGLATISLPAGDYTMAVRSTSSTVETLTYRMHIFSIDGGSGSGSGNNSGSTYYYSTAATYYSYYYSIGQYYLANAYYYYCYAIGDWVRFNELDNGFNEYAKYAAYRYYFQLALYYYYYFAHYGDYSSANYYYGAYVAAANRVYY